MSNRINLFNQIKNFSYTPDLKDLGVFSKQFFYSIIFNMYLHTHEFPTFSLIFGDFNNVNDLNSSLGTSQVDKLIHDSIEKIQGVLPTNAIISRIGGDEFCFVLPNTDYSMSASYINKINQTLSSNFDKLSIALSGVDSKEFSNLSQMHIEAESNVDFRKAEYQLSKISTDPKSRAAKLINYYLTKVFKAYRISESYTPSADEISFFKTRIGNIMRLLLSSQLPICEIDQSDTEYIFNSYNLDSKDAESVFSELSNPNSTSLSLDVFKQKQLLHDLTTSSISNNMSFDFFNEYILPSLPNDKKFNVSYCSVALLKYLNTIDGHLKTDISMKKFFEQFSSGVGKNIDLQDTTHTTYTVSLGAGDFFILSDFYKEPLEAIVSDSIRNANSNSEILKYVTCFSNSPLLKDEITPFLDTAHTKCDIAKNSIRKASLLSPANFDAIVKVCLSDFLLHYKHVLGSQYKSPENITSIPKILSEQTDIVLNNFFIHKEENIEKNELEH